MTTEPSSFPSSSILPKQETQALDFIEANATYDGRGIVVAILDTGCDVLAEGLLQTSDGKPKFVDSIDCTGSGDVDTSCVRTADAAGEGVSIAGLTGRTLLLNAAWTNPTGQWHVGCKAAFELFPKGLVTRLKKERKEGFDEVNRGLLDAAQEAIEAWDAAHSGTVAASVLAERTELVDRQKQLQALTAAYEDFGPMYDVVVWNDGQHWRAVVGTDKDDGDLRELEPLADYRFFQQAKSFTEDDLMTYSINVWNEGNILEIVTTAGSHGTHVAGIVGAYYPDQPELNGVAPGCQLINMKIGDSRLGSMETGTGLVRALIAAKRCGAHILNLSYGEGTNAPEVGRFTALASELVTKHGLVFVSSAGNNGPALNTVGAPGGTTSALIGVGAYVSPGMMRSEYAMRTTVAANQYTWSSRGPTDDGHYGVSVSAPGGAIAPVPTWALKKSQLMNGTSMSSPNCAGCVALLLSAAHANDLAPQPHTVKMALENTAKPLDNVDRLTQGAGVVQVSEAWAWLQAHAKAYGSGASDQVQLSVRVSARGRGFYLRNAPECNEPAESSVVVSTRVQGNGESNRDRVALERRIVLHSTAEWVVAPPAILLVGGSRSFSVRVDPTQVAPGKHGFAEVQGVDAAHPELGPVFRVPVTVMRPVPVPITSAANADPAIASSSSASCPGSEAPDHDHRPGFAWSATFDSGRVERRFVVPPVGATLAVVRVRGVCDTKRRFVLHGVQLTPHQGFHETEFQKYMWLHDGSQEFSFAVRDRATLELTLAQFWSVLGTTEVTWSVRFHGVLPSQDRVHVAQTERWTRIHVSTPLGAESLKPSVELTHLVHAVAPKQAVVSLLPCPERDQLWDQRRIAQLVLTYEFDVTLAGEYAFRATRLSDSLYESPFEAQLWFVHDANRRLIGVGDALQRYKFKLEKGKHTVRLQVRHEDMAQLQALRTLVAHVKCKLSKAVAAPVYAKRQDAEVGGSKFGTVVTSRSNLCPVYVAAPAASSVPAMARAGDRLVGHILWNKDTLAAAKTALTVTLGAKVTPPTGADTEVKAAPLPDTRDAATRMAEHVRDQQVAYLGKQTASADFTALAQPVLAQHGQHLPLLQLCLDAAVAAQSDESGADAVVAAADAVLSQVDTAKLAQHFGLQHDKSDPAVAKECSEAELQKGALVKALYQKGLALTKKGSDASPVWTTLKQWISPSDASKYADLELAVLRSQGRVAKALEVVAKQAKDTQKRVYFNAQMELVEEAGWSLWAKHLKACTAARFPSSYPLF